MRIYYLQLAEVENCIMMKLHTCICIRSYKYTASYIHIYVVSYRILYLSNEQVVTNK